MGTSKTQTSAGLTSSGDQGEIDEVLRAVAHAPSRRPPPTPTAGAAWGLGGRYVIERKRGSGGMGSVYPASDTVLRRQVALKVIDGTDADRELVHRARLLREARAA